MTEANAPKGVGCHACTLPEDENTVREYALPHDCQSWSRSPRFVGRVTRPQMTAGSNFRVTPVAYEQMRHWMDTLKAAINLCQEAVGTGRGPVRIDGYVMSILLSPQCGLRDQEVLDPCWLKQSGETWLDLRLRLADGLCGVSNASDTSGYASTLNCMRTIGSWWRGTVRDLWWF
ncbi:hypothetical protein BU15DRAFT_67903 [Melanogaster broomeanus]|nr:hypothetical protein BU15DRAFT_67903 [Melanogaster broomeanus]